MRISKTKSPRGMAIEPGETLATSELLISNKGDGAVYVDNLGHETKREVESVDPTIVRSDIITLSYNDPIVHEVIERWQRGEMTFEQAIMNAVKILSVDYERLYNKVLMDAI